jgi:hypothetical protein
VSHDAERDLANLHTRMGISDVLPWKANHTCNTIPSFGSGTESRKLKPSRHAGRPSCETTSSERPRRGRETAQRRRRPSQSQVHMRKSEDPRITRERERAVTSDVHTHVESSSRRWGRGRGSRSTHGTVRASALGVLGAHASPTGCGPYGWHGTGRSKIDGLTPHVW